MNKREEDIAYKYSEQGYQVCRCGAPDFLFIKVKNKQIIDFKFVEVKSKRHNLSTEQIIWKKVLEKLKVDYKIEVLD